MASRNADLEDRSLDSRPMSLRVSPLSPRRFLSHSVFKLRQYYAGFGYPDVLKKGRRLSRELNGKNQYRDSTYIQDSSCF